MIQLAMSVREAMEATTLGKTKVYQLISEGRLTKVKVGRRTLITIESVLQLISPEAADGDARQAEAADAHSG